MLFIRFGCKAAAASVAVVLISLVMSPQPASALVIRERPPSSSSGGVASSNITTSFKGNSTNHKHIKHKGSKNRVSSLASFEGGAAAHSSGHSTAVKTSTLASGGKSDNEEDDEDNEDSEEDDEDDVEDDEENDDEEDDAVPPSTGTAAIVTLPTVNTTSNTTVVVSPSTSGSYWKPAAGITWQVQISEVAKDTSVVADVYDIDLFINSKAEIDALHKLNRKVICYFSAGSYEDFRPDSKSFVAADYGSALDGWPGEWWANTKSENVRKIMAARIQLAKDKGCDGVDPDNIDGYGNETGLGLTEADAVDYLSFLSTTAHGMGLSIGLKNGGTIVSKVLSFMEWEINEQCVEYDECTELQPFIAAGKPVFHIEYPNSAPSISASDKTKFCSNAGAKGFSTVLKEMDLGNWLQAC